MPIPTSYAPLIGMRRIFKTADEDATLDLTIRQVRLARLADAKAILHARDTEHTVRAQAAYDAKGHERAAHARPTGRTPRGRARTPPTPGPRDQNQDHFTAPESRNLVQSGPPRKS